MTKGAVGKCDLIVGLGVEAGMGSMQGYCSEWVKENHEMPIGGKEQKVWRIGVRTTKEIGAGPELNFGEETLDCFAWKRSEIANTH